MKERTPHEYLRAEDYYESRSVGTRAKSDKWCEHCGGIIPRGEPHEMHHFYPEFHVYPVHINCEKAFMESLLTAEEEAERYRNNDNGEGD